MKDKQFTNNGFTIIEIIMVIVILGILAAIIVPKYINITNDAEESVEEAFLGQLKSGIHGFGSDKLVKTGNKYYPKVQSQLFDRVLQEVTDNWSYTKSNGRIDHTRQTGDVESWYYWTNYDSSQFEIQKTFSGPPPPP